MITYRQEVYRKLIHLSSLWIPALIFIAPKSISVTVFALCVVGMLTGEYLRSKENAASRLIGRLFGPMLRDRESAPGFHLSGATYTVIAALITTAVFPQAVAITGMTIMLISDAAAALAGRKWGKSPLLDKSYEGCTAFLVSALMCVFILDSLLQHPELYLPAGMAAALVAAIIELFSSRLRLDDNLSIPIGSCISMCLILSLS